jgi:hypothetical protein
MLAGRLGAYATGAVGGTELTSFVPDAADNLLRRGRRRAGPTVRTGGPCVPAYAKTRNAKQTERRQN